MTERILPLLLHKNCDAFNFDNCSFEMQNEKETCGRISVRRDFNILHSYTLECSYAGTMRGKFRNHHFTIPHLKKLGNDFMSGLFMLTSDKKAV